MEQNIVHEDYKYMVCTRCFTFNHEPYIKEAMDGFTMQKTTFPVVNVIVDDASTDKTAEVIRNYLEQHFDLDASDAYKKETDYGYVIYAPHLTNKQCWFAVVLLKENHYSQKKKKFPYLTDWIETSKYHAICEGDDYWIDDCKLQTQVEYMETHPECTMICSRTKYYSQKQRRYIRELYCRNGNGELNIKDVIYRQGLYISTCSVLYLSSLMNKRYPLYCRRCLIGDYPLQIYAAVEGHVYYFDKVMSVYRVDNSDSWMGRQAPVRGTIDEKRLAIMDSTLNMLTGFSNDYPEYSRFFKNKIADFINRGVPYRKKSSRADVVKYINHFQSYINQYNWFWRIDLLIRRVRIPGIRFVYTKLFMRKFYEQTIKLSS